MISKKPAAPTLPTKQPVTTRHEGLGFRVSGLGALGLGFRASGLGALGLGA